MWMSFFRFLSMITDGIMVTVGSNKATVRSRYAIVRASKQELRHHFYRPSLLGSFDTQCGEHIWPGSKNVLSIRDEDNDPKPFISNTWICEA